MLKYVIEREIPGIGGWSAEQIQKTSEKSRAVLRELGPEIYGSGKSPDWPADQPLTLADEAALLEPDSSRNHLVGASPQRRT